MSFSISMWTISIGSQLGGRFVSCVTANWIIVGSGLRKSEASKTLKRTQSKKISALNSNLKKNKN